MPYQSINDLEIYREAMSLGETIWARVIQWNHFEKDTLGKQLVRSADSIAANLSEGHGRFYFKENIKFCYYSRGSLTETQTWLEKTAHRNLLPKEEARALYQSLETLHKRLNAYIKSIGKKS